jgi:hypothetical protein
MTDEDEVNPADDAPASEGSDIEGFEPKRGGKRKGSGRNTWDINMLTDVAQGKAIWGGGPTGKRTPLRGTISDRLRAYELLTEAKAAQTERREAQPEPVQIKETIAQVIREHLPHEKETIYEPTRPDPSSPGSMVISDSADLAKYIRPSRETANPNERRFPNGWFWRRDFDHSVNAYRWNVFAPGGVHAAIRRTEEKATRGTLPHDDPFRHAYSHPWCSRNHRMHVRIPGGENIVFHRLSAALPESNP